MDSSNKCPAPETFTFSIRLGLIFITQAAGLSAIATTCLLIYILYSAVSLRPGATRHWSTSTHVHWYFLSLLVSDLIQAIGGLLNVKWIADSGVSEGMLCTAQGALKQLGDVGVALASLAIAIHTFFAIVVGWRPKQSPVMALTILGLIWLFLVLVVGVSLIVHRGKNYYGNTQYWCWITQRYSAQRIALEYFWMWTASLLNILLYIPIALVLKGFISASGGRLRILRRRDSVRAHDVSEGRQSVDQLAVKMLWYPAVYTCTVLPIAIVRWNSFLGHCTPWAATVVSSVIFSCSGLLNVLLFSVTRPALVPHREGISGARNRDTTATSPFSSAPPSYPLAWPASQASQVEGSPNTLSTSNGFFGAPPSLRVQFEPDQLHGSKGSVFVSELK